ncbi:MAG TPA: SRPBCC family protein [Actinoplanes sp.]|nr:SRPBCC family protein [Actinoplanes sp.]
MTSEKLADARVVPDGEAWTLIFIRDLPHPPKAVWAALTDPAEIDRWAPFTASRDLAATGDATLTMVDGDRRDDLPAVVRRADAPVLLEYTWGEDLLRWELEPTGEGTRLTLRHTMTDRDMTAKTAAGWHICLATMARLLDGADVRAIRGQEAMAHGWQELADGYTAKIGT